MAEYCDQLRLSVCVSVCLSDRISPEPRTRSLPNFCACCLWLWLGPPPAAWWNPRGRGNCGCFPPHWQCTVMRSLQITSCSSRTDHNLADGGDGSAKSERIKCDLWLPCYKCKGNGRTKMLSVVLSRMTQQYLSNDDCRENKREDDWPVLCPSWEQWAVHTHTHTGAEQFLRMTVISLG